MKNCISVADVQMCWIVYSSHDTSSAYQREIFVQIQTFGRKLLPNHPGPWRPPKSSLFIISCGIPNGRIIHNLIESAIGIYRDSLISHFYLNLKFPFSYFLFEGFGAKAAGIILNFLFPIFHLKAVSTRLVSLAEIS